MSASQRRTLMRLWAIWGPLALLAGVCVLVAASLRAQPEPPDSFSRRFPPAAPPPADGGPAEIPSAGVLPPNVDVATCGELPAELRLSCPLTVDVVRSRRIPGGVQLTLRRHNAGRRVAAVRQALWCQVATHQARPDIPPPCPFLVQGVSFQVRAKGNRLIVDLVVRDDRIGAGVLRERVATAVAGAR